MTERIALDGEAMTAGAVRSGVLPRRGGPTLEVRRPLSGPHPMSFFEVLTGMAYAAFADAPIDAAVGGGGDGRRVGRHQRRRRAGRGGDAGGCRPRVLYLGDDPGDDRHQKAGIIKAGAMAVLAQQPDEVAEVLRLHAAEVGAAVARRGCRLRRLGSRVPGVGGQVVTVLGGLGRVSTTRCSCPCTVPTRHTTLRAPSRRSRRSWGGNGLRSCDAVACSPSQR